MADTFRPTFERVIELADIGIVSRANGGDGRTVEAYATVFDSPVRIADQHGLYMEQNDRTSFNRWLGLYGVTRTQVLYNHALDPYGRSGGLNIVPIGKPLEVKPDGKGLLTTSRYNDSDLARSVLESIKNGDITGQSYRGLIFRSDPMKVPKVKDGAPLPLVKRQELGLTDYGPTPSPAYQEAIITAVRSAAELAADVTRLSDDERAQLIRLLGGTPATGQPTEGAYPQSGQGTGDQLDEHSARLRLARARANAILSGVEL